MDLGGSEWSLVEVGARFSKSQINALNDSLKIISLSYEILTNRYCSMSNELCKKLKKLKMKTAILSLMNQSFLLTKTTTWRPYIKKTS